MNEATVCVLMSTYNGEEYIEEQIESIINQENLSVKLVVRDDGSTDATTDILDRYREAGFLDILTAKGKLGAACSFMELLYSTEKYDFYAFADQDDIWLSDKLSVAVEKLSRYHIPALYASNQILYCNGIEKGFRFEKGKRHSLPSVICGNFFAGCTMVFNEELAKILKRNHVAENVLRIRMHDTWVAAVAEYIGIVIYDEEPHIKYRIHHNNAVGIKKHKFYRLWNKLWNFDARGGRSKLAMELLRIDVKNDGKKNILINFSNKDKKKLIRSKEIISQCGENKALFILKVLVGWI